jgi:tocopherol O-methyltransferase
MIISPEPIFEADVADHYDELDSFYRELWGEHVHHGLWLRGTTSAESAVRHLGTWIRDWGGIEVGTSVCDVGCGYGALARQLVQEAGAQVTAITLSRVQYEYAQSRDPSGNPRYVCANWLRVSLLPESFDTVIACESFEHMTDKAQAFSQAFRALRPGGKLVICAWLASEHPARWQVRRLLEPICREGRMPSLMSGTELVNIAAQAGFRNLEWQDITGRVKRTWLLVVVRLATRLLRERRYRRFLLNPRRRNRLFALTTLRIWLAYNFGALHYGIFVFHRPKA